MIIKPWGITIVIYDFDRDKISQNVVKSSYGFFDGFFTFFHSISEVKLVRAEEGGGCEGVKSFLGLNLQ